MYIAFDIGGTKMRFARSREGREIDDEPIVVKTPKDFDRGIIEIEEIVEKLSSGKRPRIAGGGIAGVLSKEKDQLVNSPHIAGWVHKPLKKELERVLGAPVYLENDTAIVGLGEAYVGAGGGYGIVAYLTVSTGVGGVRITDGYIDQNVFGFEPGHQIIDFDGSACLVCDSLDAEDYVSGTATELRFHKKPYEITDERVWEELSRWIAYIVNNTIVYWSPHVVVLGGSMVTKSPGVSVDRVREHVRKIMRIFPELPEIKQAELRDFGGLYGALAYVRQQSSK